MAPSATEDYYWVLELEQNAMPSDITAAYRRLARKLHPDKSSSPDATAAFQQLSQANETLKDAALRAAYDRDEYPSLRRTRQASPEPSARTHRKPAPSPKADPEPAPEVPDELAQIAAIEKSTRERSARWHAKRASLTSRIAAYQEDIEKLEQRIWILEIIAKEEKELEAETYKWMEMSLSRKEARKAARAAERARSEELERNGLAKQERKLEKDWKERRLAASKMDLKKDEDALTEAKQLVEAADIEEMLKIRNLHAKFRTRVAEEKRAEARRAREAEEEERERLAEIQRRKQERRERAAAAAEAKRAQKEAEEQKRRQEEEIREHERRREEEIREQERVAEEARKEREQWAQYYASAIPACRHEGVWERGPVYGRPCPACHKLAYILLKCPGCNGCACVYCRRTYQR